MSFKYTDAFVAIAAVDLAPVVQFYERVFGKPPAIEQGDRYAEFHLENLRIGLFKPSGSHEGEFLPRPSSISLCIEVADLDAAIYCFKDLQIPVPEEITTASHGREIYVYDPLGNRLILHEATPVEERRNETFFEA